jgi:hypothetical protein
MQARCLNKNGKNPTYAGVELRMTMKEWVAWAVPEYERFILSYPDQTPNAARFKDVGHYEIGNVRIISLSQNCAEQPIRGIGLLKTDGTKRCSDCKGVKGSNSFSKNRATKDGFHNICKDCVRERRETVA